MSPLKPESLKNLQGQVFIARLPFPGTDAQLQALQKAAAAAAAAAEAAAAAAVNEVSPSHLEPVVIGEHIYLRFPTYALSSECQPAIRLLTSTSTEE